jgi:hypothetical protein
MRADRRSRPHRRRLRLAYTAPHRPPSAHPERTCSRARRRLWVDHASIRHGDIARVDRDKNGPSRAKRRPQGCGSTQPTTTTQRDPRTRPQRSASLPRIRSLDEEALRPTLEASNALTAGFRHRTDLMSWSNNPRATPYSASPVRSSPGKQPVAARYEDRLLRCHVATYVIPERMNLDEAPPRRTPLS